MRSPAKPQSVFFAVIFTLFWAALVLNSIPYFWDSIERLQETGKLRLGIVSGIIVLCLFWTVVGLNWLVTDWLGKGETGVGFNAITRDQQR